MLCIKTDSQIDETARRRLLHFLVSDVQREAVASQTCPPRVLDLLDRARNIVADESPECDERRRALAKDILAQEMPRRRRRHIHCHGAITSDRRLLFLRSALPVEAAYAPRASPACRLAGFVPTAPPPRWRPKNLGPDQWAPVMWRAISEREAKRCPPISSPSSRASTV